ncbi:MAG TPA: FkbM family methyltransferase [Steroidobacteraceae bacterium]|nr:FkbM family methyltransferase [Steroidobacteraceae bacterium]
MNWIDTVAAANSASRLRTDLAARYPAFSPARLKEMVVVGAAAEGERICRIADSQGLRVLAVVDDDPVKIGRAMSGGAKVYPAISDDIDLETPVVIASHRVLNATLRLRGKGRRNVIGFGVLQTIDPQRFPPHSFYARWLEDIVENSARYLEAFALLADERSRAIFAAILGYRISGDITELQPYVDQSLFYPKELFNFGKHEVYIDGGCYTGDTIDLFIEHTANCFDRIVGFEPDPANFSVLAKRFAGDQRVEPKQLGLWRDKRTLRFAASHDRAAGLSAEGDVEVQVSSIDEELRGDRVTFIKMNIEGAELDALEGGRRTISKWKPKLCVSGYHEASHLWEVPLLIKQICPDHKIYLRQHDGGVIESTYYGVA